VLYALYGSAPLVVLTRLALPREEAAGCMARSPSLRHPRPIAVLRIEAQEDVIVAAQLRALVGG
jgi:hypothetical protein